MTVPFYIKLNRELNVYQPEDPRVRHMCQTSAADGERRGIRVTQFNIVDEAFPGVFHLDDSLDDYKREVFEAIDINTKQIIREGFEFNGQRYSNNLEARVDYLAMYTMRDDPFIAYPIQFATADETSVLSIVNPDHARMFALTAAGALLAARHYGRQLKQRVAAMTTAEELAAFRDPRVKEISLTPLDPNQPPPPPVFPPVSTPPPPPAPQPQPEPQPEPPPAGGDEEAPPPSEAPENPEPPPGDEPPPAEPTPPPVDPEPAPAPAAPSAPPPPAQEPPTGGGAEPVPEPMPPPEPTPSEPPSPPPEEPEPGEPTGNP